MTTTTTTTTTMNVLSYYKKFVFDKKGVSLLHTHTNTHTHTHTNTHKHTHTHKTHKHTKNTTKVPVIIDRLPAWGDCHVDVLTQKQTNKQTGQVIFLGVTMGLPPFLHKTMHSSSHPIPPHPFPLPFGPNTVVDGWRLDMIGGSPHPPPPFTPSGFCG